MNDDDLGPVLRDAVSQVRPRAEAEDVLERARSARAESTRRWGTLAIAAVVVLVTGGAAYLQHRANQSRAVDPANATVHVTAYFLGATAPGQRLFAERHTVTAQAGEDLQTAVRAALQHPEDPDYHSGFPVGTAATATDHGDHVTIDFTKGDVADASPVGGDAAMALQALVWTVDTTLNRRVPVEFTVEGSPAETLLGVPARAQYTPGPRSQVFSPVVLKLDEGASVPSGALIQGEAAAFEATVVWELRQGEQVVRQGHTMARECCTLSPFQLRVNAPPGNYTLAVSDTDPSDGEGNGVTTDTKDIEIQ